MTRYVIQCWDHVGQAREADPGDPTGLFLVHYDPEAEQGEGAAWWSANLSEAKRFATKEAAWDLWRTTPVAKPIGWDGKPNRPLTAYSILVVPDDEVT